MTRPDIKVTNVTFDQLYEALEPQMAKNSQENSFVRYDARKGLRIKTGIEHENRNQAARALKFSDATEIFKRSIENQYPGVMVGDLTIGEAMLGAVLDDGAPKRINTPQLRLLYEAVHNFAQRNDFQPATPEKLSPFSSVTESRIVQSSASIAAGRRLLESAIQAELKDAYRERNNHSDTLRQPSRSDSFSSTFSDTYYDFDSGDPWTDELMQQPGVEDRTRMIMEALRRLKFLDNGLTAEALDKADDLLKQVSPSVETGAHFDHLASTLELRNKVEIVNRQFAALNDQLSDTLLSPVAKRWRGVEQCRTELTALKAERNEIVQDIRRLNFPVELNDPVKRRALASRLHISCLSFEQLRTKIEESALPTKADACDLLKKHNAEALALIDMLDSEKDGQAEDGREINNFDAGFYKGRLHLDPGVQKPFDEQELLTSMRRAPTGAIKPPKSLWRTPLRSTNSTLRELTEHYNKNFYNSQNYLEAYVSGGAFVDHRIAMDELGRALRDNERMLDAAHGASFAGKQRPPSMLDTLQAQHDELTIQLACLRGIEDSDHEYFTYDEFVEDVDGNENREFSRSSAERLINDPGWLHSSVQNGYDDSASDIDSDTSVPASASPTEKRSAGAVTQDNHSLADRLKKKSAAS